MRKVLTFLSASLCLAVIVPAGAQAPDMFKDLDQSHWAYQAVETLRSKGILWGYPDQLYRGKRTMTRYEFAVALDRALKNIMLMPGPQGPPGPAGERGPQGEQGLKGDQGPPGVTPEELETFRRLAREFREELASLGNNMNAVNRRLDGLARDVAEIKDTLSKMPKIYGNGWLGVRADRSNGGYVDKDGRLVGISSGTVGPPGTSKLLTTPEIVHQFDLGVMAKLAGGATVDAVLTTGNYRNFVGTTGFISGLNINPLSDTYLDKFQIDTPFSGLGRGSKLSLGRIHHRVTHLTLWRPDVDTYFNVPSLDDGYFRLDGVRFDGNFGSVFTEVFAGQTKSVNGTNGLLGAGSTLAAPIGVGFNSPLAGVSTIGALGTTLFAGGVKPAAQPFQGQMIVDQLAGISLGLNIRQMQGGHIRVNLLDTASGKTAGTAGGVGAGFNNVYVLGADFDLKLADRITLMGEWAKTNTSNGRFSGVNSHENNAFLANVGWGSGGLHVNAGYKYIDPLFYAPGYWGRIGNWLNPTNVQGPTFRAGYDFSPNFGVNVGGDFYSAARNRALAGGLGDDDNINRILAGLRWNVAKNFNVTADWEGVFWKFKGLHSGIPAAGAAAVHPTEQYITLGTGLHLTDSTLLKLGYQIGDFDGHGALFGAPGLGRYSFNTFTSQIAVKF